MLGFIIRRALASIPLLVVVSVIVFVLLSLTPGDPAVMLLGQDATPSAVQQMRKEMGLDKSLPQQYLTFIGGIFRGDLGTSFQDHRPVTSDIGRAFVATAELGIASMILAIIIGIPIGILTATFHNSRFDNYSRLILLLMVSIPTFWLGLLLILLFAVKLGLLPAFGRGGLSSLVLPAVTLSAFSLATIVRMTRSSLLEVLSADYIRTARAKGVASWRVILSHALRNAIIPVITITGLQVGTILSGAALTETVFAWPGLGQMLVTAVFARDYPLIRGGVLLIAVIFIAVNLLVDILYGLMDPRIRY